MGIIKTFTARAADNGEVSPLGSALIAGGLLAAQIGSQLIQNRSRELVAQLDELAARAPLPAPADDHQGGLAVVPPAGDDG